MQQRRRLVTVRENLLGPDDELVGSDLFQLGDVLSKLGKYQEAAMRLRRCLAVQQNF